MDSSGKLALWWLWQSEFELEVICNEGMKHQAADALLRLRTGNIDKTPVEEDILVLCGFAGNPEERGRKSLLHKRLWQSKQRRRCRTTWDICLTYINQLKNRHMLHNGTGVIYEQTKDSYSRQLSRTIRFTGSTHSFDRNMFLTRTVPIYGAEQNVFATSLRWSWKYQSHYRHWLFTLGKYVCTTPCKWIITGPKGPMKCTGLSNIVGNRSEISCIRSVVTPQQFLASV